LNAPRATPFLMFQGGVAQQAMDLYVSLFADGEVLRLDRFGPGGPGYEGSVMRAAFCIAGQTILCSDSPVRHAFDFTPSNSLFVDCQDLADLERLAKALSAGGQWLMPMGDYGFSARFGWLNDRFGVSWQLNLEA
jgi:predicted 3-demethylubiquinone-9 3-methyltransferase (glyoxalase superfamily)